MTTQAITHSRTLSALAIACAAAVFVAQPAVAQTATKLECKGCVKSKQIKNNGVKSKDIKDGQVQNSDLGKNAVDGSKVEDNSLTAKDLSNEAGANFAGGNQLLALAIADQTVRSVTVTAPSDGVIIANASGSLFSKPRETTSPAAR